MQSLEKRFWSKVTILSHGECWECNGGKSKQGYGRIIIRGGRVKLAHRLSWELAGMHIPNEICVLHKCDNPSCVNTAHLFLGTRKDNNLDKKLKGRCNPARGNKNTLSKATEDQAAKIKKEFIPNQVTIRMLSKKYRLPFSTVSNITQNKTFVWLK